MKQAFSRFNAKMALVHAAITASGQQFNDANFRMMLDSMGGYKSRSHGRGGIGKVYRSRSKYEPRSGKQECAKNSRRQYNAIVNGFEIMQTRKLTIGMAI